MTVTFDQGYIKAVTEGIHFKAEQEVSRLLPIVRKEGKKGEFVFFDVMENSGGMAEITTNKASTALTDAVISRRGLSNKLFQKALWSDKIDDMKMLNDPKSMYAMEIAHDFGKKIDDLIIAAAYGSALTGPDGGGTQALPAGQKIAHGSTGLTIAKLISAKKIFMANEIDKKLFCIVDSEGLADLLATTEVTSADYNSVKALVNGEIDTFMGMKFIHSERLGTVSSGVKRCLVIAEDSVVFNNPGIIDVKIDERPDMNHLYQVAGYLAGGAVRLYDEGVVEIAVSV